MLLKEILLLLEVERTLHRLAVHIPVVGVVVELPIVVVGVELLVVLVVLQILLVVVVVQRQITLTPYWTLMMLA